MSKFDEVLKKLQEALPVTPQQQTQAAGTQTQQPVQQTPQQQQQAVQQAAKLLNMDPKVLQQILDTQKQANQQNPANQQTQTVNNG